MTPPLLRQVDILHGAQGLQQLAPQWTVLDQENTGAPFYTSYAWHAAWLHALESDAEKVMFVAFLEAEKLVGVLPLINPEKRGKWWQPQLLEIPRRTGMDLSAPIMGSGQRLHDWWPLLRNALKAAGYPSFLVRMANALIQPQPTAFQGMANNIVTRVQNHSCWFDCHQPYDNIQAGYSTRLKKILRRGERKLATAGQVALKSWQGHSAAEQAYSTFLQLEASGWKAASGTALALDQQARRFHEAFLFCPDATFKPQINLLYVGDRPVAGQLCVLQDNTISLLKIAYAQDMARFSPGSVLLDRLISTACSNSSLDTISLITGQAWMEDWNPRKTDVGDFWLFDRSIHAHMARGAASLRQRLRQRKVGA